MPVACSAWLLSRTRRRRHEALGLQGQTAVDRSERNPGRSIPAMTEGQPAPTIAGGSPYRCRRCGGDMGERGVTGVSRLALLLTPFANNGLDVDGVQVTRPAAQPRRSFGFLNYSSRDLKSRWRSPRAASLKPLDIPAAVRVKKRAAAPARHRFVTME